MARKGYARTVNLKRNDWLTTFVVIRGYLCGCGSACSGTDNFGCDKTFLEHSSTASFPTASQKHCMLKYFNVHFVGFAKSVHVNQL